MSTALVTVPQTAIEQITAKRSDLLLQAQSLTITDDASYRAAGELALSIKALRDTITSDFAPAKKAAHDAHKAVCAQEKKHLDALAEPDALVRQKLSKYAAEIDRQRQEAERAAIQVAEQQARERVIERAVEAEESGNKQLAERILSGPVIPEAPAPVTYRVPRASGIAMIDRAMFEITDAALLPREYLTPDEAKIRGVVEALELSANIPGVRVWMVKVPRVGGRIAEPKPVESEIAVETISAEEVFG
jgi:hypothetical protein